jgi:hypothetical protein
MAIVAVMLALNIVAITAIQSDVPACCHPDRAAWLHKVCAHQLRAGDGPAAPEASDARLG